MSAPWWHPEASPLADIRELMRTGRVDMSPLDPERLAAELEEETGG